MPIVRKSTAAGLRLYACAICGNNQSGSCILFADDITGMDAPVAEARKDRCSPTEDWKPRELAKHLGDEPATIETPKATIYRDPWDKIEKTYE